MRTVLITGASRGIGRALAEKFLAQGDVVIGTSRSGEAPYHHDRLRMVPLELCDARSIADCATMIAALAPKIDVFMNNAGIWDARDDQPSIDNDVLRATLAANLLGPIDFSERIVPLMNDGGHVVLITSRRGSMEWTTEAVYPCYSISKAGLNMYTRQLAARLRDKVTVSCVHPGSVRTEMNPEGELAVEEAASQIIALIHPDLETGGFWYMGERFPW